MDVIVQQWREQRPDLDPSAKQITGRIVRLASLFQQAYADAFAELDLNEGDYGVLAPLRRAGAPFELSPTELARHRMMTSGGMTAALDRLERKGLVVRTPNPADRRGSLVRLTDEGLRVMEEAMRTHAEVEHRLVEALDGPAADALEAGLRTLLRSLDGPSAPA
ncbi:MAG: MarR family transcriptional regulator [Actinobacteria bacterium]|nr:MarR family transcriptional regulator [Actinomycetota bacterium]